MGIMTSVSTYLSGFILGGVYQGERGIRVHWGSVGGRHGANRIHGLEQCSIFL